MAEAEHRAFELGGEKAVEQFGVDDINATARKHYVAAWDMASQYAYLGDKENTLKFLEAALKYAVPGLSFCRTNRFSISYTTNRVTGVSEEDRFASAR